MLAFLRSGRIWKHAVQKELHKVGGTIPLVRPGMIRAHPSRRIFSVSDRITLLIELVKGFY